VPVQLERAVHHGDLLTVLEVAQGDIEPGQPESAPRARVIRPHVNLHAALTLWLPTPTSYAQSRPRPGAPAPGRADLLVGLGEHLLAGLLVDQATAASRRAAAANNRASLWAGPTSCILAGNGPPDGTGS